MKDAPCWPDIRTILAPTDFSPASLPGVIRAAELAQRFRAQLILMTAIPRPLTPPARGGYLDQVADTARLHLASWFAHEVPTAVRRGVAVRFLAVVGDPAEAILEAAGTESVDVVVMATHARTGLRRLLGRSVAEVVVRACPSPVLTVRTDGTPAQRAAAA